MIKKVVLGSYPLTEVNSGRHQLCSFKNAPIPNMTGMLSGIVNKNTLKRLINVSYRSYSSYTFYLQNFVFQLVLLDSFADLNTTVYD
jgi:hypothetical protein